MSGVSADRRGRTIIVFWLLKLVFEQSAGFLFKHSLCKGIAVYRLLRALSQWFNTAVLGLLWTKWSSYCFYFALFLWLVGGKRALEGPLPMWMKHNFGTARSSMAAFWNKHFSLDTVATAADAECIFFFLPCLISEWNKMLTEKLPFCCWGC